MNCHSLKSRQESTGQRTIDLTTIPENLVIQDAKTIDGNLHIKWNVDSCQDDTIIPIEFLINNYPSYKSSINSSKQLDDKYKLCKDMIFFDYNEMVNSNQSKNQEIVYK